MKKQFGIVLISAVAALSAADSHAQLVMQPMTINLSGWVQVQSQNDNGTNTISTLAHASVTTASVIQALGAAVGTNFDSKATLEAVSDTNGNLLSIVVMDDGQTNDVTSFFTFNPGNFVASGKFSDSTGAGTETQYGTEEFVLTINGGLSFDVQGLTTLTSVTLFSATNKATITTSQLNATVAGSGTATNGNATVLKGSISIKGGHVAI